jgi:YHYH protein
MQMKHVAALVAVLVLLGGVWLLARGSSSPDSPQVDAVPGADTAEATATDAGDTVSPLPSPKTHTEAIDVHAIPLGDGKVSSAPRQGYVYSCQADFRGGGASHTGDWIEGDTWDLTKKVAVSGSVSWPQAVFATSVDGAKRLLQGNGLPVGSPTGTFPIQRRDAAYQYDTNPNAIEPYDLSAAIAADPQIAATASCVPMGAIGYALNGVAIYNALDDAGRDAVAHEVQDACDGHPQQAGQYHYHGPSDCMPHVDENNALVGYALDGFGIFSVYDTDGQEYTDTDLDECHGITSEIEWNGAQVPMYHYVLTREYPYTVGCFRGTPVAAAARPQQGGGQTSTP